MAVYFVSDVTSGLVKIGRSTNPWGRLQTMQTGSSATLEMLAIIDGGVSTERELHQRFSGLRERGEWFVHVASLASYIQQLPAATRPVVARKSTLFWNGKTDGQVAKATGLSPSNLCRVRLGEIRPTPENAIKLQRATGVSAIKLVFGDLASEAA